MGRTHRHTEYTLEIDGHEFPIPFEVDEDSARLELGADGLTAYLGVLDRDQDAEDPFEAFDEGDFYQFDRSYAHDCEKPDLGEFKRIIRANPGRVFTVSSRGYSDADYSVLAGPFEVSHTKGNTAALEEQLDDAGGYYIVPADAGDYRRYAESSLEQYSMWCNGEVYGAMCWRYTRADDESPWEFDEESRDSECWGYIGHEYAESERDARIKEAIEADATKEQP